MNILICLLLIWTNESYKYEYYDYCLNNNGILPYKEMSNWNKLTEDEILKAQKAITFWFLFRLVLFVFIGIQAFGKCIILITFLYYLEIIVLVFSMILH